VTDVDGRFTLGPLLHRDFFVLPIGDKFAPYELHIKAKGRNYLSEDMLVDNILEAKHVICDLSRNPALYPDQKFISLKNQQEARGEPPSVGLQCR
jgi:hypothetical protein